METSENTYKENFATKISDLVASSKMTQTEIAAKVGVSEGTLRWWCKGKSMPDLYQTIKLTEILEAKIDFLTGISYTENEDRKKIIKENRLLKSELNKSLAINKEFKEMLIAGQTAEREQVSKMMNECKGILTDIKKNTSKSPAPASSPKHTPMWSKPKYAGKGEAVTRRRG